MPSRVTRRIDRGFNAIVSDAAELKRGSAADNSQNVLYSRGTIKTPYGFAQSLPSELPLDSGNKVLGIFVFPELDGFQHFLVTTNNKIYSRNNPAGTWDDKTQSGTVFGANIWEQVSHANVLHTDGLALNGSGDSAYHHSVLSNGGNSEVQRWAGRFETDYADLLGGSGYHDTASGRDTHFAGQVGLFFNRLLLISPKIADANNNLIDNPQKILYPQAGKLESWNGTGSGSLQLLDTGDENVQGALLGAQWIQYQKHSIWSLNHIGGTTVFDPRTEMGHLGLLRPQLLAAKNNVHYFIGNDFNIYAYYGGAEAKIIGYGIQKYLQRDLDQAYAYRSRMSVGAQNSRLWIFIVPNGSTYATAAYAVDIRTGAWMKRDFTHKWAAASDTGITAVALIGAGSYTVGKTYGDVLLEKSPSKSVAIGGAVRSSNVVTVTTGTAHSFLATETVTLADVDSGGEANAFSGDHTIASVPSTTTFTFAQTGADESNLAVGSAIVDKGPTSQDYITLALTSRMMLTEVLTDESLAIGDSTGYVYQYDSDLTTDDGIAIPSRHITEVEDAGYPGSNKAWSSFIVTAKGTGVTVSYRVGNFKTAETGWIDIAVDDLGTTEQPLTSEFVDYEFWIQDTSRKIQFKFSSSGSDFIVSNYKLVPPVLEGSV